MHISEGILSAPVLAAGWAVAAGGLALGLRKTPVEELPKTALVSGVLFLISLVHVPLGPSSIHLTLLGMAGILLGWSVVPALFTALFLQALLLQFGGLFSLGVNTAVMGSAALAASAVFHLIKRRLKGREQRLQLLIPAFAAGFLAVITGAALVTAALFFSNGKLAVTAALIFAANLPLAAVEGLITVFMLVFLSRALPDHAFKKIGI